MKYVFLLFILSFSATLGAEEGYRPPVLSTTAIIEVFDEEGAFEGIVLIDRGKEPFGKALPGGKVKYGESVEHAARREMKEETNLDLYELRQFHVYSEPSRDPRHHTVEVTHLAKSYAQPEAGDDAAKTYVVPLETIPWNELTFDHEQILKDYLTLKQDNQEIQMLIP